MSIIYSALTRGGNAAITLLHVTPRALTGGGKTRAWIDGQHSALRELRAGFQAAEENYWFHCSSLGEYAIARPLIAGIKAARPQAKVVLTFFSSTGVNALRARKHQADFVGYLPPDTPANARRVIDIISPTAVAFMVSEYWPNYLEELRRRGIRSYLVSAIFSRKTPHFARLGGRPFRHSLEAYTRIFALDRQSVTNLSELGYDRVELPGDPLTDNAVTVAASEWEDPRLADFTANHRVMVAGSISDDTDAAMCAAVANSHPDARFIFAPHEVDDRHISLLESLLRVPSQRISAYDPAKPCTVLIIDNIGTLAYLYRYGTMAYIGGGFTSKLHSMIEASVYGLPTAFGPRTERKVSPAQLCEIGVGRVVTNACELNDWYEPLMAMPEAELHELQSKAIAYCRSNCGATDRIIHEILHHDEPEA